MVKRGDFMKKILYLIGLLILFALSCYILIVHINFLPIALDDLDLFFNNFINSIFIIIQSIFTITIAILCIVKLFKTHISMPLKYTYEEYKQNKLNAKKEKLKKQLEEIEKTE
jgi:hypothetical protein